MPVYIDELDALPDDAPPPAPGADAPPEPDARAPQVDPAQLAAALDLLAERRARLAID